MDGEQKGPKGNCPDKPVVFQAIFKYFIDDDQKYAPDQKHHEVTKQTLFLFYSGLSMFQEFMLLYFYK